MNTEDDDIIALRALVREFGLKQVRPNFHQLEREGEFPSDLYRQMGALGFFGACFPKNTAAPMGVTARWSRWPKNWRGSIRR